MSKEMDRSSEYSDWYKKNPVQMVDISEAFVGIGKMLINGHSLYRYIEDTYKLDSSKLPLALIAQISESIAYSLSVAGFKDSFIVLFQDEERECVSRSLCTREMVSALEKHTTIKKIWFKAINSSEFALFVKEEHICIAAGYSDERSLAFLNTILGFSLYAAVIDQSTFRAPRLFMFVLNPSQFSKTLAQPTLAPSEHTAAGDSAAKEAEDSPETAMARIQEVLEAHTERDALRAMQGQVLEDLPIRRYPANGASQAGEASEASEGQKETKPQASFPRALAEELFKVCAGSEKSLSLFRVFDGVLYQAAQSGQGVEGRTGAVAQPATPRGTRAYPPTGMASITFYNEEQQKNFRTEQMYIENLKKTAQSLHDGKNLHCPISLVTDKPVKKKKETKEKISKKQLEIIEANTKQKEEEAKKKDIVFLKSFLSKYQSFATSYEKRRHLEGFLPRIHSPLICSKVLLLKVEFYGSQWALEKRKRRPNEKDFVSSYMDCTSFIEKYGSISATKELEYIVQTLLDLGFASTVLELCEKHKISYINTRDRTCQAKYGNKAQIEVSFDPAATKSPNDFDISFLMRSAGDKLKRSLNSRPDDRLLFEPDEWQIYLLDIVDRGGSAVICAPTSTGKTFICYYAMEKVLRESNDNIVVFVAPTKALVNQVAADVYARFGSKPYIKQNNILQGICMNDFQISPFNCQVLITVPEILEKILTMPPETKKKEKPYLERIKYIVIDEVHKISDSKMGSSMEKIIHFSPCSLLLLSATLGNLDEFYTWTKGVENRKGRTCDLVVHREKYCEVNNYVFVPKKLDALETCHKSTREPGDQALAPIHSLFAYSFRGIKDDGFSDDVNFLPEELLNLYYAIFAVLRKDQRHLVKEFRPQRFFKTNCITKGDVKEYEKYVITKFREMMKTGMLEPEQVSKIYDILIREAKEGFQKIENDLNHQMTQRGASGIANPEKPEKQLSELTITPKAAPAPIAAPAPTLSMGISSDILLYSTEYLLNGILDLVVELEAKDMLPCIVFNLERTVCNALATRLVEELEKFEKIAEPILSKMDIRENEKILKEMKRSRDAVLATGKDAWIGESIIAEEISSRKVDPNAKDPRFCFTDPTIASSGAYVLDEYAKSMRKTGKVDGKLINALYRGVGVHHTGTPKKYRNMIEILFRMKQLRVVFATETLSLGINMPCRTSVFAGDSLSLDSMSFKQMAGRAGRRGYDTQGNVVFFGIPKQKVQSLITSYLPRIKGSYAYTNGLAMQAARPTTSSSVTDSFIHSPLMSLSLPTQAFSGSKTEDGIGFRERLLGAQKTYLSKKGFLDRTVLSSPTKSLAQISSLSNIPMDNIAYDPESFVLMTLVSEGVLEDICTEKAETGEVSERSKDATVTEIIHLLASIFEVCPIPAESDMQALEPLPKAIASRIEAYTAESIVLAKEFMTEVELETMRVVGPSFPATPVTLSFLALPHQNRPKSSYILSYFVNPKVKEVLRTTGLGETELFVRLKGFSTLLETLCVFFKTYSPGAVAGSHIENAHAVFLEQFKKMHA
ncbi:hypothetical protein NEDG_00124 [Nematocida displodere]|uniref:DEAD/DEAH box helicase n=1 Tax=Nematocida displodere TaxID=1805483 RepID=A0A177EKZ0_9MICR|nr:hypothetical protein NEDG_00124 [Nematocida displodere]